MCAYVVAIVPVFVTTYYYYYYNYYYHLGVRAFVRRTLSGITQWSVQDDDKAEPLTSLRLLCAARNSARVRFYCVAIIFSFPSFSGDTTTRH